MPRASIHLDELMLDDADDGAEGPGVENRALTGAEHRFSIYPHALVGRACGMNWSFRFSFGSLPPGEVRLKAPDSRQQDRRQSKRGLVPAGPPSLPEEIGEHGRDEDAGEEIAHR